MANIIKENRDVFQSYILTTAKYNFSIYEKRIMYRLVEMAQDEIKGILIRDNMHKIEPTLFGDREITMPVADILKDKQDKNYTLAKEAFTNLATKGVEYEDEKIWSFTNIISSPNIEKGSGIATFKVDMKIWQCILDFSKGYRKYELETIMKFKSVYSMRMYELMSGQQHPLECGLRELKERFGLITKKKYRGKEIEVEKFKVTKRFEQGVLDVAKKELDECSPYSFKYEQITKHSRGRGGIKIIGYKFYPIYKQKNGDSELERKELQARIGNITGHYGMLRKEVSDYLLYNLDWDKETINKNKETLLAADKEFSDFVGILSCLKMRASKQGKGIGWIINAIKAELSK